MRPRAAARRQQLADAGIAGRCGAQSPAGVAISRATGTHGCSSLHQKRAVSFLCNSLRPVLVTQRREAVRRWLALSQKCAQDASFQPPRPAGAEASARQARSDVLARLRAAPPDFAGASSSDLILFAREAVRTLQVLGITDS